MIILGIDPGTATTGFGVIKTPKERNSKAKVIDFGCIITDPKDNPGERLKIINNELNKIILKYKPQVLAVENLFFFKNLKTVMPVSQAKGVILLTAAKKRVPVVEFTPLQVKMAITGYGKAEKKQMQKMMGFHIDLSGFDLKLNNRKKDDAIDALGVAVCCFLNAKTLSA